MNHEERKGLGERQYWCQEDSKGKESITAIGTLGEKKVTVQGMETVGERQDYWNLDSEERGSKIGSETDCKTVRINRTLGSLTSQ